MARAAYAGLESLENRMLLSSVVLSGNSLVFNGDQNGTNTITATLSSDGQTILANIDGNTGSFAVNSVNSMWVYGGIAGDTVIIDPHITVNLTVTCGDGNDYVSCGGGNSTVYGNGGNDTIIGNGGQNEFHGGAGDDSIVGGSGASRLYGDDGNDTIIGGSGSDVISGGTGNNITQGPAGDTIINNTNAQSTPTPFSVQNLGAHILFKTNNTIFAGEAIEVNGLNSGIGVGTPLSTSYHWNFGDTGSEFNDLDGWSAGHIYNTPGLYTVTFTLVNQDGQTSVDTQQVNVLPVDSLRTIYVAPWGNDSNDGLSPNSPIQTTDQVNSILGSNTQVLFAAGGSYNVDNTVSVNGYTNVEFGSYGSGAQPILMWDGPGDGYRQMIVTQPTSTNIAFNNLTFDSIYTAGPGAPTGIKFTGNNFAVTGCTFLHLAEDFDLSGAPIGTLIQDNSSPDPTALQAYFVWVQGSNATILGNYVADSAHEHVIRVGGAKQTLIAYNNLANISGKGVLTIQYGSYIYVDHNVINGPSSVGPLATTQVSSLINNFLGTFNYAVFDANTIYNGPFQFEPGSYHTMLRNNVILANNDVAIIIQPYDELYGRTVTDAEILGNTVVNQGIKGNFLMMVNTAVGTVMADNLFVANNLDVGNWQDAPVYIGDTSLESFSYIANNVWSANATITGGMNYVFTSWWNPAAYLTPSNWNNLSPVSGDLFESSHLNTNFSPVFNGDGAFYGIAVPGLFDDFYGALRPTSGLTDGAVQIFGAQNMLAARRG
jgi:hypothetical protein